MATISIDVESNKADLDALVATANSQISALQATLAEITSFQLAFTVSEVPPAASTPPADQTEGAAV